MKKWILLFVLVALVVPLLAQDNPSRTLTQPVVLADLARRVGRSGVSLSDLGDWKWSYGTYTFVTGPGCIGAPTTDPVGGRWQRWDTTYGGTAYVYLITDNAQTLILCNEAALTTPTVPAPLPQATLPPVTMIVPTATGSAATGSLGGPSQTSTCLLPSRLIVGGSGRVTPGDPNWLRQEASQSSAKLGEIPAGGTFTVSQGPICDSVSGVIYWYVIGTQASGWTGEGANGVYWLEPVPTDPSAIPTAQPPQTIKVTTVTALRPAPWVTASQIEIQNVIFSPQMRYFVVLTTSGRAALYDADSQDLIKELQSPGQQAYTKIEFNLDDTQVATADVSNTIYVWDVASVTVLGQLSLETPITALVFSRDNTPSRLLAVATTDGQIRLWASMGLVPHMAPLMSLTVEGTIETLEFSPDNRMLIARDINDKMLGLWEVEK